MRRAASSIQAACEGLADFVASVAERQQAVADSASAVAGAAAHQEQQHGEGAYDASSGGSSSRLGDALLAAVREMQAMDWLVPPMLSSR